MARDGIRQARAQHHELLLALIFGRANRAAHRIIKTAQLALGPGVHVAHAADYAVGLIVQVERIGDQFFDIDLRRSFKAATVATAVAASIRASTLAPIAMRTAAAFASAARAAPAFAPGLLTAWFLLCCFRHPNLVFFGRFLFNGRSHASVCYVIPSVDSLAHSSATRPEGRNFKFTGFFPTRSAIRLVRAF